MYKIFDHAYLAQLKHKTPFYLYDDVLLQDTLRLAQNAARMHLEYKFCLHYAIKANDHPQILAQVKQYDFGVDCVSGGEIKKALKLDVAAEKIVFAGVGKTNAEIKLALKYGIYAFNVESIQEAEIINILAKDVGVVAKIMLRINPDVDAKTHKHIATGKYANKFGIAFTDMLEFIPRLLHLQNIKLIGLHYHIGSQILDLNVFQELVYKINLHYKVLQQFNLEISDLDIGGGLGIDYKNPQEHPIADFTQYFTLINKNLQLPHSIKLHFELGRSIVAQCGGLITQVLYTKNTAGTNFAIVDAGMNDLMRPALYSAQHKIVKIENVMKNAATKHLKYHIVGPVCESTDVFAKNLRLPILNRNDKIIIYSTGAYGKVLASTYNSRPWIKEYFTQPD